jgi:Stress responsive A/B Barrel Domain
LPRWVIAKDNGHYGIEQTGTAFRRSVIAIVVDFDDEQAFSRYSTHPAHARLVSEFLRPILQARQAVQFNFSPAG